MIRAALKLAERGLAVFPCRPRDKRPATLHGVLDATTDAAVIDAWWTENADYNIGVACGAISKIFVVDVDGAEAELGRLEAQHGEELPPTIEVITARGRHIYFKYPGVPVLNTVGRIADGIDTRSDAGYVLAPPSLHPSGRRYRWSVDCAPAFADAPAWLIDLAAASPTANGNGTPSDWHALAAEGAAEGKRNITVAKLTGHLLRRYVDPVLVLDLMQVWNAARCSPPLSSEEVETIVNSICAAELRRRTREEG